MATPPEPIAIIGISCRFPGGADTPSKLWDILKEGRQTWTDVPEDRWNWKSFYHPHPEANGAHNARGGCFLEGDISEFDAGFFNMPPPEAHAMDPQHRLQLESAYEALENAGISAESARGTDTGVYMAVASRDYDRMAYKDTSDMPKYHLTGVGDPVLCGRISYVFDLKGPSMTLDTGCSGSMVCLHQAATSLRNRESRMALVGGTHVLLGPDLTMVMSLLHMINDDGRCYAFDSRGAGYGRAEGVATIVLKRLDDAIADGDPIRAVLRNTGVNSDGKTNGILLPSSSAQQMLMRNLYTSAGIDPAECGYVEAHGTGTAAGDAAETNTISNIFCKDRERDTDLFVGSVKANIGHTEATSGLAGLIKVVLMLEKGLIPPVPGIETLKDSLNLGSRVKIPRSLQPWPQSKKRLASINSFGFGGTNAHCIVEAAPERKRSVDFTQASSTPPQLFILSAKTEKSLKANIERLNSWTSDAEQEFDMGDLAYTLATRRSMMLWRWSTVASDRQSLIAALSQKGLRLEKAAGQQRMIFLFTGQGAQWHAMGRELIHTNSRFGQSFMKSDEILQQFGCSWSLLEEILKDKTSSRINEGVIAQPASTAIQIALVDLMHSLNIKPRAVLGHSSGEIGAAYAAGYLTHETALRISYQRSFVSSWSKGVVKEKGAMMAVGLGEPEVLRYISNIQNGTVVVACVNSPSSTTISGDDIAIDELKALLEQDSVFARKLQVDTAYHSHHMKAVASIYLKSLDGVKDQPSPSETTRFFSSVTGQEKTSGFGASYWVENLVSKVRFSDGLEQLALHTLLQTSSSVRKIFVELGPHGALAGPTRQTMSNPEFNDLKYAYLSCLSRGQNALQTILELSGKLSEQGVQVDLKTANTLADERSHHVLSDLTPYAWDHSVRYWNESRLSKDYLMRNHPPDELLGSRIPATSLFEPVWRNMISADQVPWLQEHIIDNFALFPGSAYLCMAMQALTQILFDRQITGTIEKFVMRDIIYSKALVVPNAPEKIEIQLSLKPSQGQADKSGSLWQDFRLTSVSSDGVWNEHCRGSISAEFESEVDEVDGYREQNLDSQMAESLLNHMKKSCSETVDTQGFYDGLRQNGIDYGEHFTILKEIQIGDCKTLGTIEIPDVAACMPAGHQQPHVIHPATMDAVMHIVLPLYSRHCSKGAVMLISVDEVTVSTKILKKPGQELTVACNLSPAGPRSGIVNWAVFQSDENSKPTPVVTLSHGEFRGIGEANQMTSDTDAVPLCYQVEWDVDVDNQVTRRLDTSEDLEQKQDPFQRVCSELVQYVKQLAFKKPHLKILEIGAGIGAATSLLMLAATDAADRSGRSIMLDSYTFTDSSADNVDVARSVLKRWRESMTFKTLSLDQDLVDQGFEEGAYDLVVATSIPHGTSSINEALTKARILLKPGGRLLMGDYYAQGEVPESINGALEASSFSDVEVDIIGSEGASYVTQVIAGLNDAKADFIRFEDEKQNSTTVTGIEVNSVKSDDEGNIIQLVKAKVMAGVKQVSALPPVRIFMDSNDKRASALTDQLSSTLSASGFDCSPLIRTKLGKASALSFAEANTACLYICSEDQDPQLVVERLRYVLTWSSFIVLVALSGDKSEGWLSVSSVVSGFARTARKENNGLRFLTVDVQNATEKESNVIVSSIATLIAKSLEAPSQGDDSDSDYVLRDGQLLIPRLRPVHDLQRWIQPEDAKVQAVTDSFHQPQRPLKLYVETPGLLNSMKFVDDKSTVKQLGDDEVEVQAMAFGVNQNDVAVALGRAKPSTEMMGEFAGLITAVGATAAKDFSVGQRVCGWSGTSYASRVRVSSKLLHQLPDSLSFSQGASIPLAFEVAYQALVESARLQRGQTVLIHSASGAVGQAAVMIAQHIGAQVFATVGSASKRQFLVDQYQIPESHVFSSRTRTFKKGVLSLTLGQGVDVILNSLSGDMLTDTWACVAEFGVFVEVGSQGKHQLSMQPFERNVTLASIDVALMKRRRPQELQKTLQVIINMMSAGQIKPVHPVVEVPLSDLETAFRQVQAHKHTGKIVLIAEKANVPVLPSKVPTLKLDSEAAYVIIDLAGELGSKIATFMVSSGAQNIVMLESKSQLKNLLEDQDTLLIVKGVIHVEASPPIAGTSSEKVIGEIVALDYALQNSKLDFFVMISAIEDAIGGSSDAEHTAASAWKGAFANSKTGTSTSYVSLAVGPLAETDASAVSQGQDLPYHEIKEEHLMKLLNFVLQRPSQLRGSKQIWMGLQRSKATESQSIREDPLFSHVPHNKQSDLDTAGGSASLEIDKAILAADSPAKVQDLITEALAAKIASLVAMDQEDISLDAPVANFGLDSLIAIEFKNWISRALMAPMQTSEILDVPDIVTLATLIAQRSTLLKERSEDSPAETAEAQTSTPQSKNDGDSQALITKPVLPKLPLNDLESFCNSYFESVRGLCTKEELESFIHAIEEFKKPGGMGHVLQGRLAARAADPSLANWNVEQYVRESFLDRRYPLVPYTSFFFTHPLSKHEHTQAERAALIATTAFEFKQKIDAGQMEQQYLNERPLSMHLFQWIFNTAREPRLGSDEIFKYPGYDHIIVYRKGHAFKVDLREDGVNVPFAHLRDTFEDIIATVGDEVEWAGVLANDHRDKWAKNREELKAFCKGNEEYLAAIDQAAFMICLDDAAPTNASDRAQHFHFGNGSNRWNDKSTQFAVCSNGVSGHIGDHTNMDAGTVAPLNSAIKKAIEKHVPESLGERAANGAAPIVLEELKLVLPSSVRNDIERVHDFFIANTSGWKHVFWNLESFGSEFMRRHKVAPNSAFQVIVQLAGREFFGFQNYCWETVSVAHFDHGRVEVNPLAWPQVVEFCEAATNSSSTTSTKELRRLFIEACKSHAASVHRASQGKGTERHYKALGHMLQPNEPKPLLYSDPLHTSKIRTFDFMSSCFPSDMAEKGYLLSYPGLEKQPDSLWIHIEVYNEIVKFNITARDGRGDEYCDMVVKAAQMIKNLLESAS